MLIPDLCQQLAATRILLYFFIKIVRKLEIVTYFLEKFFSRKWANLITRKAVLGS